MARFTDDWLRELLSRNSILDVIGQYIPLTKKGATYWATCPWHPDRNPSFSVTPGKEMFYCYSCKRGGSVIQFIMEQEKVTFMEAVEMLAARCGMEIPEPADDADYKKTKERQKHLYAMMREAALYYHNVLKTPQGKAGLDYLKRRGAQSQIVPFGLGYAPDSFDSIIRHLKSKGYTEKDILDGGLAKKKENRIYDTFRGRVMFPIMNVTGDVIGFGGRIMDQGEPKYLNSQETVIFNKRRNLYALSSVKKNRNLKSILLVEGYMDVIGLASYGIKSAVASLGTSFTKEQARLLKRYTEKVYLSYDGDPPGINAALKAVDILQAEGLQAMVILLPGGQDPDEFIREHGREAFYAQAEKAMPATMFKLSRIRADYDLTKPDDAVQYSTKAVELIGTLKNEIEKERYIRMIAEETGFSETGLYAQLGGEPQKMYNIPKNEINLSKIKPDAESKFISFLLENPEFCERTSVKAADFETELYKEIYSQINLQIKRGILVSSAEIVSVFAGKYARTPEYERLMASAETMPIGNKDDYAAGLVLSMKKNRLLREKQELMQKMDKLATAERIEALKRVDEIGRELRNMMGRQ